MWGSGVVSLVRQGRLWRRRRRTARVADESAPGPGDGVVVAAAREAVEPPAGAATLQACRAVLAMARGAVRLDGGGGAEEEWAAATGWRAAGDEVGHLVARESLRYVIYA